MSTVNLEELARLIRYYVLLSTTEAGSGHPTSAMSAVELMTGLLFGGTFRADLDNPDYVNNDRLIFSKGHASPLFYALYAAADRVSEEELRTYRKFESRLEGHPTMEFPYTEASTGSLGQGLSIGFGMALNAKYVDKLPYRTYVLLGDSEMAEGSQWEAMQLAAHYNLHNLVGILDVNRLGQTGETMHGHSLSAYEKRIASFGWKTITLNNGHDLDVIQAAYQNALETEDRPVMIIAKTVKGKGVPFVENVNGRHGKALSKEEYEKAIEKLGEIDKGIRGEVRMPETVEARADEFESKHQEAEIDYPKEKPLATRKAYGNALARIFPEFPDVVVLDGEVSNSTYAETFAKAHPERFFEMYIAEQNMVGAALGFSRRGKTPFVSTFAAFFSRAFDQIRMSQYANSNIKFAGSHAGVSIGEDGSSQMGLEDIAMFRTLRNSVVLYPSDAVSTEKLVEEAARHRGNVYIRTTRMDTPILYENDEAFSIGGSKTLRESEHDAITVIGAGVTLHEIVKAYEELQNEGISIRVVDCYSIKPLDREMLEKAARETKAIMTVEDHYPEGGMGEAIRAELAESAVPVRILAVRKIPRSGTPAELLNYEEISSAAITQAARELAH